MGKIVVTEFISLDGVIEDPGGSEDFEHGGWSFEISRGEEGDQFKLFRIYLLSCRVQHGITPGSR